jgi:hypothetical protein
MPEVVARLHDAFGVSQLKRLALKHAADKMKWVGQISDA